MERSTYFLVSLFALAMGAIAADEQVIYQDESTVSYEELAALKKQSKGFDVLSGDMHRLTTLEDQMKEVYTPTVRDTFGAKAASARPQVYSYHLYVSGDFLYWQAFEGGKDFASATHQMDAPFNGRSKWIDFNWKPGFRTEFGYRTSHDSWDLAGHYTWFYDKGGEEVDAPKNGGITQLFYTFGETYGFFIESHARLHFQEGDIALQKMFFLSPNFSLGYLAALRSTWISQKSTNYYYAPGISLAETSRLIVQSGKNDFWGIGPKFGIMPKWFVDRNWSFFGALSGSLLYGEFDVRVRTVDTGGTPTKFNADLHQIVPTVQGMIGAGWETNFLCHYHIAINVAYEAQYWWRQNQMLSYLTIVNSTDVLKRLSQDLGFHGLTVNASFDF